MSEIAIERHDHWRVTVETSGEHIVSIEPEMLAGREPSEADYDAIRTAANHLLAFAASVVDPLDFRCEECNSRTFAIVQGSNGKPTAAIRCVECKRVYNTSPALASLSHTMGVKGEECHCTKIEQDETCPVGYPSLLCDDCDGKGIRSALTPTQQAVPVIHRWRHRSSINWHYGTYAEAKSWMAIGGYTHVDIEPLYALASPQAAPGWEQNAADILAKYDAARENQKGNGTEINLIIMANYGDLALQALRAALNAEASHDQR